MRGNGSTRKANEKHETKGNEDEHNQGDGEGAARRALQGLVADLTIEGLSPDEKNLKELLDWVKELTPLKREDVYTIEGGVMNREYHLTGTNAYPDTDCTLVCVKLADMEHPKRVAIPRFHIGGRWFTDIVDNNARREGERTGTED